MYIYPFKMHIKKCRSQKLQPTAFLLTIASWQQKHKYKVVKVTE